MSTTAPRFTYPAGDAASALTVIDANTDLEWLRKPLGRFQHQDAIEACAAVDHDGGGFRLPTRAELLTLVDLSKYAPVTDSEAFPEITGGWFWSSDITAWSSASAWCVYFDDGGVSGYHRNGYGFALAVRRAGQ